MEVGNIAPRAGISFIQGQCANHYTTEAPWCHNPTHAYYMSMRRITQEASADYYTSNEADEVSFDKPHSPYTYLVSC